MECKQHKKNQNKKKTTTNPTQKTHKKCSFKGMEKTNPHTLKWLLVTKLDNAFLKHCSNTVLFIPLCSCYYSVCICLALSLKRSLFL